MTFLDKIKSFFGFKPKKENTVVPDKVEPAVKTENHHERVLRPTQRVLIIPKETPVPAVVPVPAEIVTPFKDQVKAISEEIKLEIEESVKELQDKIDDIKTKVIPKQPAKKWVCKAGQKSKQVLVEDVQKYIEDGWSLGKKIK